MVDMRTEIELDVAEKVAELNRRLAEAEAKVKRSARNIYWERIKKFFRLWAEKWQKLLSVVKLFISLLTYD